MIFGLNRKNIPEDNVPVDYPPQKIPPEITPAVCRNVLKVEIWKLTLTRILNLSAQKSVVQVCQVAAVVMETTQLVLRQVKNLSS